MGATCIFELSSALHGAGTVARKAPAAAGQHDCHASTDPSRVALVA